MARRKRKHRDNVWFDHKSLHRKAARKGWRHRKHSRRDNPVAATSIMHPVEAVKSGFKPTLLKRAAWIVGGNLLTTFVADKIINSVSMIKDNKILNVLTVLGTAGLAGAGARMVPVAMVKANADDVLLGGMLAGLTRTLKIVWPSQFGNLSEDLEGLEDYVNPMNIGRPIGVSDYVNPLQIGRPIGVSDYGSVPQAAGALKLDGLSADEMVANEIGAQA